MAVSIGQQPVEISGDDARKAIAVAIKNATGKAIEPGSITVDVTSGDLVIKALAVADKKAPKPSKPVAKKVTEAPKSPFEKKA